MKAIICVIAFAAAGQVPRSLPQLIQELGAEDYAAWAEWQNRQAITHTTEGDEPRYRTGTRMTLEMTRRALVRPPIAAGRRHRGSMSRTAEINRRTRTYPNPHYRGPKGVTLYNPFVRAKRGVGKPDWDNLYVIMPDGKVQTLAEAMDVPVPPEKLYRRLMEVWFK